MAKTLIELVGDAASAVRALEQTTGAVDTTTSAFKELSVSAARATEAMVASSSQRIARFQAEAQAASQLASSYAAVGKETEAAAAATFSQRRAAQATRLLGAGGGGASALATAGTIGRGLTTYVTAPAAFISYEAIRQAVSFNQQMLLLKTQAGDATDNIHQLSKAVLDMARTSPQGPEQLAQGLYHLVSLGLRGSQALGTLHAASLAAGMGIANLEDTTTALGAAVVSGIRGAQNYSEAMGTLVATAGAGNMRMEDLAASVGNVIPSAAAAGISLHEMGAALAVLTDRGMSSEEAATRLRMSLALIQRPSGAATKALADMGVNADSLGAMIRQPNGLLKVLETLHAAMDKVGAVRGNRDLLEAFGGARSGIGIQTLVQSLTSPISSYQGKLEQVTKDQQQFARNQKIYMESPSYKLHAALSEVQADLVKLGTALTPAATGLAKAVSGMADAFSALPKPIKESIGIAVGVLAVGGPLGLAIKGVGTLVGGLGAMFRGLGASAVAGTAEADVAAGGLLTKLRALKALGTIAITVAVAFEVAKGMQDFSKWLGGTAFGRAIGAGDTPLPAGVSFNDLAKAVSDQRSGHLSRQDRQVLAAVYRMQHPNSQLPPDLAGRVPAAGSDSPQRAQAAADRAARIRADYHHGGGSGGTLDTFQLPQQLANELAKAQAGYGNLRQTEEHIRSYILRMIASGKLRGKAIEEAYNELATINGELASQAKKAADAAKKASAAAAKAADTYALPLKLQMQMARADALAALLPGQSGPTSQQLELARRAKADAMKVINSHTASMQKLIAAWGIVGQANSVLAQANPLGQANTYHAVSSAAIVGAVKGLTHAQQLQLRQRISQAEAHRGYAPNQPGSHHSQHHVTVHVKSNDSHIVKVVKKHHRDTGQRAGARR